MSVAAVVPAAGSSTRLGGRTSKPFITLNDQPLLAYTLQALQQSPAIRWIVLVVRDQDLVASRALLRRYRIAKALSPCLGGASRTESVAKGVAALPRSAQWVLVHDAARPCVSRRLIQDVVRAGKRWGAAACGLPAALTVKAVDAQREVRLTLDRAQLWFMQTPQVFRRDWFVQALSQTNGHLAGFPDDAAVVESAGFPVKVVPGDPRNLKVTTKDDLLLAEAILKSRKLEAGNWKLEKATTHSRSTVGVSSF